jgi:hypothetical protein
MITTYQIVNETHVSGSSFSEVLDSPLGVKDISKIE